MGRLSFLLLVTFALIANGSPEWIVYTACPEPQATDIGTYPVKGGGRYAVDGGYVAESFAFGALVTLRAFVLDGSGGVLATHEASPRSQGVWAVGYPHRLSFSFAVPENASAVRVALVAAANPVTFSALPCSVKAEEKKPLFPGVYDKEDPPPADRAKALAELAKIPPATAEIVRRGGRTVALVDGKPMPYNQYKGFTDYRQMGECGADLVLTFNRGTRLFRGVSWDRPVRDEKTGVFDFSRIEDTLLRIYNANPRARVVLTVGTDPDRAFLEAHPDSIFANEKGERGRVNFLAFAGFDSKPLDPKDPRQCWAYSYTSKAWRDYVEDGLKRLCAYLKTTPASNIVIGFRLAGGMDGQFVQWQYGPETGHFDHSGENVRALREYLRELYGTDAALQAAWGDASVTLETARNPTAAEFHSRKVFDDRPGFGRRLADCRRFVSAGPARTLNGFAKTLRREFGRPCILSSWYTSTIWSQPGRLALDELVKGDGVNTIVTVSDYAPKRSPDGPGCSADNSIAGLNLRNLLYVQEMDHRTCRTQHTGGWMAADSVAMPSDWPTFANQVRRDAASVIAAGGAGFHLFDMFGSWYHGEEIRPVLREIFALNRFATEHAGEYPQPRVAIFGDEKARLLREGTYNNVDWIWRTSGVMPAIHYLSDVDNPQLPDYDLYVLWQPITITARQLAELKRRASARGKVLAVVGEAGTASRDFTDTADVLAHLGLKARHEAGMIGDAIRRTESDHPLLDGVSDLIGSFGAYLKDGKLERRYQAGYAVAEDRGAQVLGTWERQGGAAFVRKSLGNGSLVFVARDGGLTPRLLNNLAKAAGVKPFSEPGNAVFVGNGVACVHSLGFSAEVDFGEEVRLTDFAKGTRSEPVRKWRPDLKSGESAAVGYAR